MCLETAWHLSRLCRIHVRCHAQSTVILLRRCPVPGGAAAAIANLFSIIFQPSRSFAVLIHSLLFLSTLLFSSSVTFPSFLWSSHSSLGSVFRADFRVPSCCFHFNLSSGKDAIRIANLHFILLCVLIQHWFFAVFISSMASSVLLCMYSIHFSSSISAVSISSSVSFSGSAFLHCAHSNPVPLLLAAPLELMRRTGSVSIFRLRVSPRLC